MTFFRETWRLLSCAAAAIAGSAFIAAPVQAATVNFGNCTSGGAYQSVTVDASGNFTISCTAANGPGTVGFGTPATYPANFNQVVPVSITRTGGTTGQVGANLSVTGGCTLSASSVTFAAGDGTTQSVNVTAPGSATACTVNLAVTGGAVQGLSSATVNVVDPNQPGTFFYSPPQSGPSINQNWSFTIQRSGGSNGNYDIPFTATPTGLTGASIAPASPIRFLTGETTKTLTLATGSTPGTMVLQFGTPVPVLGTTATTTFAPGPITITVTNGGNNGCPTPASNVVVLPDMPVGEGAHTLINLAQGQIGTSKLPTLPADVVGATITQTQTQGTGEITKMEIGISPCPGDIMYGAPASLGGSDNQQRFGYSPCYTSSSFITNVSVAWHLTVSGHYAFCFSPVVTGPWYVNVRYTLPGGCSYGQGACGASFQWNRR